MSNSFSFELGDSEAAKLAFSLPDYLEMETVFGGFDKKYKFKGKSIDV